MKKKYIINFILICYSSISSNIINENKEKIKIQIVGGGLSNRGIEGIGIKLFESLIDDFEINYTLTTGLDTSSFNNELIKKILYSIKNNLIEYDIAIYTDLIAKIDNNIVFSNINLLKKSKIKIALSMLECSPIPHIWVQYLNDFFDYIIVPTEWVKKVYILSGVKKPIYVIPLIVEENDIKKIKTKSIDFIFGCIGGFGEDKNLHKVAQAFLEEFKDDYNVKLIIKASGSPSTNQKLAKKIISTSKKTKNIKLIWGYLSKKDLFQLLLSFDAFVLASKGEGFSLLPREAMDIGIPCVLSYNSSHIELCDQNLALPIISDLECLSDYRCFGNFEGKKNDCQIKNIRKSMREMYNNYEFYFNTLKKNKYKISNSYQEAVKNCYKQLFIDIIKSNYSAIT